MSGTSLTDRRIKACVAACAGISTDDLRAIATFSDYLRLLKLSYLADRQAATMEGAPKDEFISAGGTQ